MPVRGPNRVKKACAYKHIPLACHFGCSLTKNTVTFMFKFPEQCSLRGSCKICFFLIKVTKVKPTFDVTHSRRGVAEADVWMKEHNELSQFTTSM